MTPTTPDTEVETPDVETEEETEKRIDVNNEDSFPASDPPSWSPTVTGPPPKKPREEKGSKV
jgi:hypothetical protein